MICQLADSVTTICTERGPWKRIGYREVVDTETGEITVQNIVQHYHFGKWIDGPPPRPHAGAFYAAWRKGKA